MPPEGVKWKPHNDILSFEEIIRIAKIMTYLGIRNIRITGGEPLLRRGMIFLIKELKSIKGIEKITLTTNGLLLGAYLNEAGSMGLPDGINISLDALDNECYKKMTGSGFLHECKNAEPAAIVPLIDRLLEKKITVKINCVPVRASGKPCNEKEIVPIAALAKDRNIFVRFIELMPLGSASVFQSVPGEEAAAQIENFFGILKPAGDIYGSGPAVYYSLPGFTGKIGFINAVTHIFCETCNRLRLTSEGSLRLCLSDEHGLDLRALIRAGAGDDEIIKEITEAVKLKPRSHAFKNNKEGMSEIGG